MIEYFIITQLNQSIPVKIAIRILLLIVVVAVSTKPTAIVIVRGVVRFVVTNVCCKLFLLLLLMMVIDIRVSCVIDIVNCDVIVIVLLLRGVFNPIILRWRQQLLSTNTIAVYIKVKASTNKQLLYPLLPLLL